MAASPYPTIKQMGVFRYNVSHWYIQREHRRNDLQILIGQNKIFSVVNILELRTKTMMGYCGFHQKMEQFHTNARLSQVN